MTSINPLCADSNNIKIPVRFRAIAAWPTYRSRRRVMAQIPSGAAGGGEALLLHAGAGGAGAAASPGAGFLGAASAPGAGGGGEAAPPGAGGAGEATPPGAGLAEGSQR